MPLFDLTFRHQRLWVFTTRVEADDISDAECRADGMRQTLDPADFEKDKLTPPVTYLSLVEEVLDPAERLVEEVRGLDDDTQRRLLDLLRECTRTY